MTAWHMIFDRWASASDSTYPSPKSLVPVMELMGEYPLTYSIGLTPYLETGYDNRMDTRDLITIDPDVLGGTPVFKGTRVPVKTLFEYLEDNYTLDEFLECFPSVSANLARSVLDRCEAALLSPAAA